MGSLEPFRSLVPEGPAYALARGLVTEKWNLNDLGIHRTKLSKEAGFMTEAEPKDAVNVTSL